MVVELAENTLVVFVSDSHIGGDPGCDGFQSPEELKELFDELASARGSGGVDPGRGLLRLPADRQGAGRRGPGLAHDFASRVRGYVRRPGADSGSGKRNGSSTFLATTTPSPSGTTGVQETLRRLGLVDEFAYYYLASVEAGGKRRVIYCEHGNQLDAAEHRRGLPQRPGHAARPPRRHGLHQAHRALRRSPRAWILRR